MPPDLLQRLTSNGWRRYAPIDAPVIHGGSQYDGYNVKLLEDLRNFTENLSVASPITK